MWCISSDGQRSQASKINIKCSISLVISTDQSVSFPDLESGVKTGCFHGPMAEHYREVLFTWAACLSHWGDCAAPEGNHILSIRFNDVLTPAPGGRSSQTTDTLTPCFPQQLFTPGLIVVNKASRAIAELLMSMPLKCFLFLFHLFNDSVMFNFNINFDSDVNLGKIKIDKWNKCSIKLEYTEVYKMNLDSSSARHFLFCFAGFRIQTPK